MYFFPSPYSVTWTVWLPHSTYFLKILPDCIAEATKNESGEGEKVEKRPILYQQFKVQPILYSSFVEAKFLARTSSNF